MGQMIFPLIGIFSLGGLLYAEKTQHLQLRYFFKPLTSILFLLTAIVGGIENFYGWLIFAGLFFGFLAMSF